MDISYPKLIIYYYDIDGFIFSMKHKYQGARYLSASELLLGHAAAAGLQHAGVDHLHPGAGLAAARAQGLDLEHGIAVNNVNSTHKLIDLRSF